MPCWRAGRDHPEHVDASCAPASGRRPFLRARRLMATVLSGVKIVFWALLVVTAYERIPKLCGLTARVFRVTMMASHRAHPFIPAPWAACHYIMSLSAHVFSNSGRREHGCNDRSRPCVVTHTCVTHSRPFTRSGAVRWAPGVYHHVPGNAELFSKCRPSLHCRRTAESP